MTNLRLETRREYSGAQNETITKLIYSLERKEGILHRLVHVKSTWN